MGKERFSINTPLHKIIQAHKAGMPVGIYSVCSSNRMVLQAAMRAHRENDDCLLIESTCNQVNQEGGYTGMTPMQFTEYLRKIALEMNFPVSRIILGGDHLGPNPWRDEDAAIAMEKAGAMVQAYVKAGYGKIHLDTSMTCAGENELSVKTMAERAARLCLVAENTACENHSKDLPVYVIGTEVPSPGGMTADQGVNCPITKVEYAQQTLQVYRDVFSRYGLEDAFRRIIALVVSPGVEFNDRMIFPYDRSKIRPLREFIASVPGMVFEAHSTDYQTPQSLEQMVQDHFSILKVGPALTFAFREALFRLAAIEEELFFKKPEQRSYLIGVLMDTMHSEPAHWKKYYTGTDEEIHFDLKYSFSDRVRYYWGCPAVQNANQKLMSNLGKNPLPLALVSQYFPHLYPSVQSGDVEPVPLELVHATIRGVIDQYRNACGSIWAG